LLVRQLQGKTAGDHSLSVKLLAELSELSDCQMFFISRALKERIDELLARPREPSVLIVSEVDQFAQRGGMINFIRREDAFRLEINLEAAEKVGLKVSSKLSTIATLVKTQHEKQP
jgi:uncharacterized protein DUF4154